jgi:hypothetical protein
MTCPDCERMRGIVGVAERLYRSMQGVRLPYRNDAWMELLNLGKALRAARPSSGAATPCSACRVDQHHLCGGAESDCSCAAVNHYVRPAPSRDGEGGDQ